MKKTATLLIPLSLITSLASAPLLADTRVADYDSDTASIEEATGFFSGAILGAIAGGPPGAIVGAAIGAFAGDGQRARSKVNELQSELYIAQIESRRLQEETEQMQRQYQLAMAEIDRLRQPVAQTIPAFLPGAQVSQCCDNTVMSIHFRSGSSVIESQYQEQLHSLAQIAQQMPGAVIEITGYADRTGDTEANMDLSQQRSTAVKSYFQEQGLDNATITTFGYGESRPLHSSQSLETDFFDRRVNIRLRDNSESMLSQSPDGE